MLALIGFTFVFGLINVIKPLNILGISTRRRGLMVILASFGLSVIHNFISANNANQPSTSTASTSSATAGLPYSPSVSRWRYSEQLDKMRNQTTRYASLNSDNELSFQFPYNGGSTGELTLRVSPKYGKDVILQVTKGQFLCSFEGCYVHVKFDNRPIVQYGAAEPSDGTSNLIFIHNYAGFVQQLKHAKKLTIEAEFYQEGRQQLEFSAAGLNW